MPNPLRTPIPQLRSARPGRGRRRRLTGVGALLLCALVCPHLHAQALAAKDDLDISLISDEGVAGLVPATRGFNASLVSTSQYDSSGGWSSVLAPDIAYRFNQHLSVNLQTPTYAYLVTQKSATSTTLVPRHFLLGDTELIGELDLHPGGFSYNLSASLGMPTGDDARGLGAGQFTYAFIHHIEHPLGDTFTPNIELGLDDSPNLVSLRVRKSYNIVGTSAHFQAGMAVSLPFHAEFESDAYEELPIASQTFTSITGKGKKARKVTTVESAGEDNGFNNTLDLPVARHLTVSGFYNRSLRNRVDTAGFSLTFLLRPPPRRSE